MNPFTIKPYLIRLYLATMLVFFVNKFIARPFVLDNGFPDWVKTIVLSVPNTCEAIIGSINTAVLMLVAKVRLSPRTDWISDRLIYRCAFLVTAVYVLTQEFKIHNLGGRNVYDPYDAVASVVGVIGMLLLFSRFGVIQQSEQ